MLDATSLQTLLRHAQRELAMAWLDRPAGATCCAACGAQTPIVEPTPAPPPSQDVVAPTPAPTRVERILAVAEAEWRRGVIEPPQGGAAGYDRITGYIKALGWSDRDLNQKVPGARYENGSFAWCGCFAGWVLMQCGFWPQISDDLAKRWPEYRTHPLLVMSSCARIMEWAQGTDRVIPIVQARPGDIPIVGSANGKWYGAHVTIARDVQPHGIATYEGNAHGDAPDGRRVEGVIQQFRPYGSNDPDTYVVKHVIRPLPADWKD